MNLNKMTERLNEATEKMNKATEKRKSQKITWKQAGKIFIGVLFVILFVIIIGATKGDTQNDEPKVSLGGYEDYRYTEIPSDIEDACMNEATLKGYSYGGIVKNLDSKGGTAVDLGIYDKNGRKVYAYTWVVKDSDTDETYTAACDFAYSNDEDWEMLQLTVGGIVVSGYYEYYYADGNKIED